MDLRLLPLLTRVLLMGSMVVLPVDAHTDMMRLASVVVEKHAEQIYRNSHATGMSLVVIDNHQVVNRHYGETRPGSGVRPHQHSLIRLASITKLLTSEVMVRMAAEGQLNVNDPLSRYRPNGGRVPDCFTGSPIRLYHLATHTSGLPREQPGRPTNATVFTWPTAGERWHWLKQAQLSSPPGTRAAYSNLAYDLLADGLSNAAGKPYPTLLKEKITRPLGMHDTTYTPSAEQCGRLLVGKGAGPCKSAVAAVGSGGVYSTPQDMQIWMRQLLNRRQGRPISIIAHQHKIYFNRDQLVSVKGMDVAGQADGLGLGWVRMQPRNGQVGMLQKTGGGGGFMTYMALVPEKNIGVFVVITRGNKTKFSVMSSGVNQLISELAHSS